MINRIVLLFVLFILTGSSGFSEWRYERNVPLGNVYNSRENRYFAFNTTTNKIYIVSYSTQVSNVEAIVIDAETLTACGEIDLHRDFTTQRILVNNTTNFVYIISDNEILMLDGTTHQLIAEASFPFDINFKAVCLDEHTDRLFFVNSIPSSDQDQFVIVLNAGNLEEISRIDIPKKVTASSSHFESKFLYRCIFYDYQTDKIYLGYENRAIADYDEMYLIDLSDKEMVSSYTVGVGPYDILKNRTTGKIYVFAIGAFSNVSDHNEHKAMADKGHITVIGAETFEVLMDKNVGNNSNIVLVAGLSEKHNLLYHGEVIVDGATLDPVGGYSGKWWVCGVHCDEDNDELFILSRNSNNDLFVHDLVSGAMKKQVRTGIGIVSFDWIKSRNEVVFNDPYWINTIELNDDTIDNTKIYNILNLIVHPEKSILYSKAWWFGVNAYDMESHTKSGEYSFNLGTANDESV